MNIVFDLDGTLIDSAPDIQAMAAIVLQRLDKPALTLDETRRFIGEGSAVFVQRMMSARSIVHTADNFEDIHGAFVAEYATAVDKAVLYPGALALLIGLKTAGHRLGLCTNKPEAATRAVLKYMKLEALFAAVIAGGMLPSRKPEPDMLHQVAKDLGGGETLYIGDSEIDAEASRRAGIPFALFAGGYRKLPVDEIHYDWLFEHYDELPEIIEQVQRRIR